MNDIPAETTMAAESRPDLVVDAIYEDGVIRPFAPLDLPDHTVVHLRVAVLEANPGPAAAVSRSLSTSMAVARSLARSAARLRATAISQEDSQIHTKRLELTLFGV